MFSVDGSSVFITSGDCTAKIFDGFTGECKQALSGYRACQFAAVSSADGSLALIFSDDCYAKILDSSTGECKQILFGHDGMLMSGVFSC